MNKYMKRILMGVVLVSFAALSCGAAVAKPVKMKVAGIFPEDYYLTKTLERIAEKVKERTEGQIIMKVYPMEQLGDYESCFGEVMEGTIEVAGTFLTGRYDTRLEMGSLPYLATSWADAKSVFCDPASPYARQISSLVGELGVHHLATFPEAFMGVTFTKDRLPENLYDYDNKERTLRTESLAVKRDTYALLGYQTVTLPLSEVFSAMQTGVIDGGTGSGAESNYHRFRDVMGAYVVNYAFFAPNDLVINKELWESLTDEQRKIISDVVDEEKETTFAAAEASEMEYRQKLVDFGVEVIVYPEDKIQTMSKKIRAEIWPKYYEVFGEEFLKELASYKVD